MSGTRRWTGGGQPGGGPAAVPQGARTRWADPLWWTTGNWDGRLLALDGGESARIAVFGVSEAGPAELARALAASDLGAAVRRWPGAFGVVRAVGGQVEVLADAVGTVPVYWTSTATGVVWSTHARALAALTGGGPDPAWLGRTCVTSESRRPAPRSPGCTASRRATAWSSPGAARASRPGGRRRPRATTRWPWPVCVPR